MKNCQIYEICNKKLVYIPLVQSRVTAGFPSPAEGYEEDRIDISDLLVTNPSATFFVKVKGNSMLDANIYEDDILVVDKSIEPAHGQIVIAVVDGEFTVKTLYYKDDIVKLVPANPDYPEIVLKDEQELNIWGVVKYTIHKHTL